MALTAPSNLNDLLQQVLLEPDDRKRKALYQGGDADRLVVALKAEVDRSKRSDAGKALLAGERALEASRWVAAPDAKPHGHWALALGLSAQGRFEAALHHFEAARSGFRTLNLEVEGARVALGQVQPLAMLGRLQEACELAEATRRVFLAHGLTREAAKTDNNLGIVYVALGQLEPARAALERALAAHQALGEREETMLSHINLGDLCQEQDRYKDAEAHLRTALALAQALGKRRSAAGTLLNLALLYRRQGRLSDALDALTQLRATDQATVSSSDAAIALLEEARVRSDLNLLNEAQTLAEKLVETFTASDMKMERAEALTLLGEVQAKRGRLDARETFEQARALWQQLDNQAEASLLELYSASLELTSVVLFPEPADAVNADPTPATLEVLETAQRATATLAAAGRPSAATLGLLVTAQAQLALNHLPESRRTLEQAASQARELGVTSLRVRSAHLSGQVAQRQNRRVDAERHYREAVEALESVRATLAVDEFKAAYLVGKLQVYDDLVALLLEQGHVREAFDFVERAKSRTLLELLGRGDVPQPAEASAEPRVRALLERLKSAREALHWHVLGAEKLGAEKPNSEKSGAETIPSDKTRRTELRSKIHACETRVTALLRELERLEPQAAAEQVSVPDLTTFNRELEEDAVLLEYFSSGDALSAFVVTSGGVRCVERFAPLEEVEGVLKRLEFYLSRVALGGLHAQVYGEERLQQRVDEQLRALHEHLLAPLDLELKGHLVVVPHGSLYAVPFTALYDGERYLLDKTQVSVAPSAAVYRFCKAKRSRGASLVAFGVSDNEVSSTLPAVRGEVEKVTEGVVAAQVYLGERATRAAFFEQAPAASLLHLATHGSYRPDNPMYSGLRLADGWLNARDLYGTRLRADLVVLSACESGLTESYGYEPFGLVRAFLHAGAVSLVASLWSVKDAQTAEFMHAFYDALKRGDQVAAALREAQLQVRLSHPNPYYWAGFNVLGDAARSVDLQVAD